MTRPTDNAASDSWRVATDWFWLVHDKRSGKPLLSPVHTGLGLGAALLTELLITEYVTIHNDVVTPTTRTPPQDVLAHQLFSLVLGEPQPLSIRTWLLYLSDTAREDVGRHLERSGLAHAQRTLLRRTPCWVPVDIYVSIRAESRLRLLLLDEGPWVLGDAVLCGLSDVTGLLGGVLDGGETRAARKVLPTVVEPLPPVVQTVLSATRAAVSAAVLSERR